MTVQQARVKLKPMQRLENNQRIVNESNKDTRARVFGGWLVKAYECQEHASYMTDQGYWARTQSHEMSVSMAFVPDPQHRWDIKDIK